MRRAIVLILVVIGLLACGRKGDPKPPEVLAPSPVRFLTAVGGVDGITLSWFPPETDASGSSLYDLTHFLVEKGEVAPGSATDFEELKEIATSAESPSAMKHTFLDTDVKPGKIYDYRITAHNDRGGQGLPPHILRVTFVGQSSVIEAR